MAESHLVSGLKTLRAERLGDLERINEEIRRLEAEAERLEGLVGSIDNVLKDQAPDLDLSTIKPVRSRRTSSEGPRSQGATSGTGRPRGPKGDERFGPVTKHILRVMREETFPLTAAQILDIVARQRGETDVTKLRYSVNNFLSTRLKEGVLSRHELNDGSVAYSINRSQAPDPAPGVNAHAA